MNKNSGFNLKDVLVMIVMFFVDVFRPSTWRKPK